MGRRQQPDRSAVALGELVLAAFRRAWRDGHDDAAEHLLNALECLCPACEPDTPLARAYAILAGDFGGDTPRASP